VIRRERGNSVPRVSRILVLSKEQAIRDQIADDLRREVTSYGICSTAPRVLIISHRGFLDQTQLIEQYDISASCINMLFPNNIPVANIEKILAMFQMIVIDEPHYAVEQVLRIIQAAYTSLCFGLTGSPIKANGKQLSQFTLFSVFDYYAAHEFDQSMKRLVSPDHLHWGDIFEEVDILSADLQCGGQTVPTDRADDADYWRNARPAVSVAESVVRYVHECDENYLEHFPLFGGWVSADHRDGVKHVVDLTYAVHGMIEVETIQIGELVCKKLNQLFDSDRSKYRSDRGYRCEIVRSDVIEQDEKGDVKTDKAKKLKVDHPWMQAKHNGGKLTETSARFLVVVGMGREGVSNELCGVVGIACRVGSQIDIVQRACGRQLRSYVRWVGSVLHVPPARLDTVKIISHVAFDNAEAVKAGVRYVLDMAGALDGMPTMSDLLEGTHASGEDEGSDPEVILTAWDKLAISGEIGKQINAGREPEEILVEPKVDWCGPTEPRKKKKVDEWVEKVVRDPNGAANTLGLTDTLIENKRVVRETIDIDPSDETLMTFIKRVAPNQAAFCKRLGEEGIRDLVAHFYRDHARQYHHPAIPSMTSLKAIKTRLFHEIKGQLGGYLRCEDRKLHALIYTAMQMKLGMPAGDHLRDGEKYDIPENHIMLTRPEIDREIRGWVIRTLAMNGHCPDIAAAFRITVPDEVFTDAV
jgi:hypothetical protein